MNIQSPAVITALTAALLAGAVATPAVAVADSRPDRPELQQAIQEFVDAGFLGMHMRVNDERGEWVGSAGVRKLGQNLKPSTNGLFRAGSVTKNFVATLTLQLVADGKIGLDASVAGYLPEFGLDPDITVRTLLHHTSGLFNYTGDFNDKGEWETGLPSSGKEWVDNRFKTYQPQELVRFALTKERRFEPKMGWRYSNTNYTLAQLVIEKVTGRPLAEELKQRILRPLKMRGTVLPGSRSDIPGPHAHGYYRYEEAPGQWKVVDVTRQNPSILAGAGDIISTTQDLHTYFSALNTGKLIPATLLAEMRKTHPNSATFFGKYGLGLFVKDDLGSDCGTVVTHSGSAPGGYGALMYSSPDGKKTLTASITTGDAAKDPAAAFPAALDKLLKEVFCAKG